LRTGGVERGGDAEADARSSAGDDDDVAIEVQHGHSLEPLLLEVPDLGGPGAVRELQRASNVLVEIEAVGLENVLELRAERARCEDVRAIDELAALDHD